ncbi:M1 family aminopeptidase [Tengunoibacter tsumagoiensis]|uniref:Aminopeptidase N n=1 Tax=Tengunoibacter tsumagoiensis TaxID=2014871 RepID=A0A401ZTP1_9CHLR|nr:M1 family aminopeptidase [Tengunoibacter tsumagoiensis]GCE10166.1 aminopeptidase [Tengunoibacter tsumagoiensis]
MKHCQRGQTIDIGDGYSLFLLGEQSALPTPHARDFELPGDPLQYAPERPADVTHVKLEITLDFEQETISGTAFTTFVALYEEVKTIYFDAVELQIAEISIADGTKLAYSQTDKKLAVTLDRPYKHGEEFTVAITYSARPRTGLHFMKPVPEDPTRFEHAWTFGQPRYHSYWFPCHDAPNDRATTEIIVTVPARFVTISNGNLLEVIDHGATRTHHWLHNVPHAAYLVSLVVGDFAVIEDKYKEKPVTYYVRKDRKEDAPHYMGKTPRMMQFFSEYTGVEYAYDKYAQTVVEIYTGAMEHTTATTHSFALLTDKKGALDINDDMVLVVAHELAHQWFGDLVTCRDWSNGWLNEGFATYFEQLWGEHDRGQDAFKYEMLKEKQIYLAEDKRYRRPVVYYAYHDQGFELFDAHLYKKGGWVLHMLRHQLGENNFRRGIQAYLERYRTKEVITADLERTLEEVTGHSLARFFQQWIYSGGYPELDVTYSWDGENKLAKVKIKQKQKVDDLTPCFYTPLDIAFTIPVADDPNGQTRTISLKVLLGEEGQTEQSFYLPLEREPLMVRIDPDGWLLKTLSFERSTKMLTYQLANDPDVLGRIEAAEALGELKDEANLEALKTALFHDAFEGVRAEAARAIGQYGNEKALNILIQALNELDPRQFSRVRSTIARRLGTYQENKQPELAQRAAETLRALLEKGDVSYLVEAGAAEALGQTRTAGSVEVLDQLFQKPSWNYYIHRSIAAGLGATGEEKAVAILTRALYNSENYPSLRMAAALGLQAVGSNRLLYSEEVRKQAVTALSHAVQHDSWSPARQASAAALMSLGDASVAGLLDTTAKSELDDGAKRRMRLAAHNLRQNKKDDEQLKLLRKDLDDVREENRKLKEQLAAIEARLK